MSIRIRSFRSALPPGIALPLALVTLLASAGAAAGQSVSGTVVEEGTGASVSGAIVTLIEGADRERGAVLTDADGTFELPVGVPGTYRLRIERIGYRTGHTDAFDLERGEREVVRATVPVEAVEISGIEVRVEDRCATRPEAAEALSVVWGEARKALETTRLSRRRPSRRFEIVRTERVIDPRTRFVLEERVLDEQARGVSPFSTRAAGEVAEEGWATLDGDRMRYWGPDVEALLSDRFLDDHCFRLVREGERIGLGFAPVGRGERVEIRGVLWLDRETRELRSLEFGYVGLPYGVMEALAEGQVEFERLEDGRWIVARWRLRAPEIELEGGDPHVVAILESEAAVRR